MPKRPSFLANADKAAEFYKQVGQESAEMKSAKETWFGNKYVMVTIHWAARFRTLDRPVEFDVSYLVQLTDERGGQGVAVVGRVEQQPRVRAVGRGRPEVVDELVHQQAQ